MSLRTRYKAFGEFDKRQNKFQAQRGRVNVKPNVLSGLAICLGLAALAWAAYLHFGRTSIPLEHLVVDKLTAGSITVKSEGRELAVISKSNVTAGGALVLFSGKGDQVLVASDGALALRGGDPGMQKTLLQNLSGWSVVLAGTPESSTLAMKGEKAYEIVIEAGRTLDDPLAIRGGRINVRSGAASAKLDASGIKPAPPREW
jgi:hypothetical protein